MIAACWPGSDAEEQSRVRSASEGVPLFVEELLASPGIPQSISDTVRGRLAEFSDDERAVLETAAVMGRHFDWEILPAASGQPPEVVSRALARAADRVLVTADGAGFPVPPRPDPGGCADVHAPAPAAPGGGERARGRRRRPPRPAGRVAGRGR